MKKVLIGVYGASGMGREVMPLVRAQESQHAGNVEFVFIDDSGEWNEMNSHRVLAYEDFLRESADVKKISISIANSKVRQMLYEKHIRDGVESLVVKASNVVVMDDVKVGQGSVLCPFVTLTSNIRIGLGFQGNIYSYVAHDCVIGDFVTFAPGAKCNGNIEIHDHAYIGTGAVIKQGRPGRPLVIGEGAVVGMGAVVTKDVPAGVTVVGNPAKPLVKS